jgi:hypothetical protein
MRIRGEMKETLLEAVRIELLSRMIDMLPLSMYRRRCRVQHSFLSSPAWALTSTHAHARTHACARCVDEPRSNRTTVSLLSACARVRPALLRVCGRCV